MKTLLLATLLASLACTTAHQPPSPAPATFDAREFTDEAEAFRKKLNIPALSIAVVINDQIVLAEGLGYADVEQKIPATADTLYPIGSITKAFTSTLMLQLVEAGRLDLEKPVAEFVDWEVPPNVLIRHVLSHTSEGTPGTRFAYSNRFNWLDNVVEAATKEKFAELLTNQVLQRAGLMRTFPGDEAEGYAETLTGLAKPYNADCGALLKR